MLATANPEINVEDLMRRIREEVLLRKQKITLVQQTAMALPRMSEDQPPLAIKDAYAIEEFLPYHDEDFVRTAYRAVLRREPDSAGLSHYLSQLRQGALDKTQLIADLKCSPEGQAVGVDVTGLSPIKLPTFSRNSVTISVRPEYQLAEFLSFHDEEFIHAAYRGVLHREVDSQGYQSYLPRLRQGELSKIEILGHIRYSPEGKSVGTIINGLWGAFTLRMAFKLPVIGYALALANYIVRLPSIIKNFERFEAYEQYTKHQQIDQMQLANATALLSTEAALNKLTGVAQQALIQGAQNRAQIVKHINAVIAATEAAFRTKAPVAQVEALAAQTDEKIVGLSQTVETKAATAQVEALAAQTGEQILGLSQTVETKAAVAQVEALAAQTGEKVLSLIRAIETKADNERLTQLTNHLVELVQHKAGAADVAAAVTRLGEELAQKAATAQVDALAARTNEKVHELTQALQTKANANELAGTATRFGDALAQKADAATTQQETRELQRQILDHKHNILDQQRRLALLLEEARKRLPAPISTEQIENMVAEEDHLLDAFYVSFEDRFRGTREDIKQRVAVYLPIVKEAKAGTRPAPILDVGCGRGEWLQLLGENGLVARGVDLNRVMVSQCQELGLEVIEADAIAYLRNLKPNSLGAVTGMHIIEHIPFKRLISLFDEVLRVLKPGGVAIFETPNPENLIVGACNFYYDPTHLNPLPPEPMRFVMEARGYGRIEIMRLHPQPESATLKEGSPQVQQIVNGLMFGPQDYSLVAYKN